MRRSENVSVVEKFAVFAAPGVFVVLWASGFIGAKFGLPYAEPLTFLTLRMLLVGLLIGIVIALTRPPWPNRKGVLHSAVTGVFVHGLYLGGVFVALQQHLPAGLVALVVSLQPLLTVTLANRWLGERVVPRQWAGLLLGIAGVALVVQGKAGGETTALGWTAAVVALVGMTIGTLYQKHFGASIDWRPGFLIQYAAAGSVLAIGALLFESRTVTWSVEFVFALGWLVFVLSFGAIWLLYFLIRRHAAARARAEPVLSHAAGHGADGLCRIRRASRTAADSRHGGLCHRRVPGELAHRCAAALRPSARRKNSPPIRSVDQGGARG